MFPFMHPSHPFLVRAKPSAEEVVKTADSRLRPDFDLRKTLFAWRCCRLGCQETWKPGGVISAALEYTPAPWMHRALPYRTEPCLTPESDRV